MNKILLLGGNGYVGSFLRHKLSEKYSIENVDLNWFTPSNDSSLDFNQLEESFIQQFDSIILLAGHSSVKMCDGNINSSFNNNVRNFVNLLNKITFNQKFIYASSSSVYGNTQASSVNEEYSEFIPNNPYDLSKQVIDLYASQSGKQYYGLRLGTVNGWSPHLRVDLMINSMVNSALSDNHIKLYVKDIMRPILGINDLSRAIDKILVSNKDNRGIYNLASFNSTSGQIAQEVGTTLQVPVQEYDVDQIEKITNVKLQTKAYNFSIQTKKFIDTFQFQFEDTMVSIVDSLKNNLDKCVKTVRSSYRNYE